MKRRNALKEFRKRNSNVSKALLHKKTCQKHDQLTLQGLKEIEDGKGIPGKFVMKYIWHSLEDE